MLLNRTRALSQQDIVYPTFAANLPPGDICDGHYVARFIESRAALEEVFRLRFEVFNLELGEGLETSFLTGLDQDKYDSACHHLAVYDSRDGQAVGTYRIQTSAMAATTNGFYSAEEFDLRTFPSSVIDHSVELGRACILPRHRNTQVLFLLWKGLAKYVRFNAKRFLFGCCSLTSQDPLEGLATLEYLRRQGMLHTEIHIEPQPDVDCRSICERAVQPDKITLPRLFRTYLRFGAKVCGPPAIDRQFRTIDFLVLFDVAAMDQGSHRLFFGD